ncbi:hypothetical protein MK786_10425 [Microbacterium sp. CFH 31415]|uniref:hypothetical protein n=1 Tax=Microbacterium sp. CFH 31415 TaxID=2921732 RepID=UPI001F12F279|nr:hypothetical protein [Microbacterium sp. CFH 31415]MCH6231153.1 hypothetical protein [Microbacterium sp. CFH 31415]
MSKAERASSPHPSGTGALRALQLKTLLAGLPAALAGLRGERSRERVARHPSSPSERVAAKWHALG